MDSRKKPFLDWFGYSRRERRSTFILFIILVILIVTRFLLPQKDITVENLSGLLNSAESAEMSSLNRSSDSTSLFSFDPNTSSYDTLILLGFSENQARTVINYRNKGGKFSNPSDLKKIYGLDEQTADLVIPFIDIETETGKVEVEDRESSDDQEKPWKIDINRADSAALEKLPGIGPVLSSRIIKYRKILGGFVSTEQLHEVYGLTDETYKMIERKVFADSTCISRIDINDEGFNESFRHPYLDKYEIRSVLKYRELKGRILNAGELIENKILTADKVSKISPYLRF
jgi:DNA uptake protein ComE-like DNA-binding protein